MFRTILVFCGVLASAALAAAEFSLDENPELLTVKTGGASYAINPHPLAPARSWIMECDGDAARRLWVECLTSSPVPESRKQGPFPLRPSLGSAGVTVIENTPQSIAVRVEYWLSTFGEGHGPGLFRRSFAYGRLFAEFRFTRDIPEANVTLTLRCQGRAPFVVDDWFAHLGGKPGQTGLAMKDTVQFPIRAGKIFPVTLNSGETLTAELKVLRPN